MRLRSTLFAALFLSWLLLGYVLFHQDAPGVQAGGEPFTASGAVAPVRLRIATIGLDAPVTPVGLTAAGAMDVPVQADTVGWYDKGPRPGESGSAVLAGHLDTVLNTRGIFWNLKKLKIGDIVNVQEADGRTLFFAVREVRSYPYDRSPMQRIFAGSGGVALNLITCAGDWVGHHYDERLVVFTQLIGARKE
jgi:sortase A